MVNPAFCPVIALLLYLRDAEITYGPVFPSLSTTSHATLEMGVYTSATTHRAHLKQLFTYVGGDLASCTSHSIRKAAVSWAVRCHVPDSGIVTVGRWRSIGAIFLAYMRHGMAIARRWSLSGRRADPVFSFWTFNSVFVGEK